MSIIEDKLKILSEDDIAIQAICAVFDQRIEKEQPVIKDEDNEVIGQKYRAYKEARRIILEVLKDIENYKLTPKSIEGFDKSK